MNHDDTPLPVCDSCDQAYDPYDMHTCKLNQIQPRKRKAVEDETPEPTAYAIRYVEPTAEEAQKMLRGANRMDTAHSALSTQPGGDHYRKHAIQPVEYIVVNDLDFFQGNIVKYATRHKDKGGAEDIRKIIHYAQLILELQYKETK